LVLEQDILCHQFRRVPDPRRSLEARAGRLKHPAADRRVGRHAGVLFQQEHVDAAAEGCGGDRHHQSAAAGPHHDDIGVQIPLHRGTAAS
jgi:hypothetical protein